MAYGHTNFSTLKTQLANRLGDASKVFWSDTELGIYILEALRTFQSISGFWRQRGVFATAASTPFYDLPTKLSSLLAYTLKDSDLVKSIQYHLIENANTDPTGTTWVGTDMFVLDDVTRALERRRNQFLADTGIVVKNVTQTFPSPPSGRVVLADTTIDVRRAVWKDVSGNYYNLWKADEWQLNTGAIGWAVNLGLPYAFSIMAAPPLTLQLAPVPIDIGTLDRMEVQAPAALDPTTGVLMNIPDDYTWGVKWGALADLLGKDGQARDPNRAAFCETRYQMAVEAARNAAVIVQAEINGVPLVVDSLQAIDAASPGWQGTTGTPTDIGVAGLNMIALRPNPDGIYSVTGDVIRNAVVPAVDGDLIQLGREQLDMIIDYSEHLAAFKMGGAEFDATLRQAQNFFTQAAVYNERLAASALFVTPDAAQSRQEEQRNIRRRKAGAIQGVIQ